MSFTNVPVFFDSFLDNNMPDHLWDQSFPPRRHALMRGQDWRFDDNNLRHPENLRANRDDDKFKISLQVGRYKPEEINLKLQGNILHVSGKHDSEKDNGFESSEFERSYTLPEDIQPDSLISRIGNDGVLHIEANRRTQRFGTGEQDIQVMDNNEFKVAIPTTGFKAENISVKLNERELIVHAEEKEESDFGGNSHCKQMTRNFSLPRDADVDNIKTELLKDGTLVITTRRDKSFLPKDKILRIKKI